MQDESSAIIIPIGQILYSEYRIQDPVQEGFTNIGRFGKKKKVYIDLLGTRETKISRPQDVKKINQIFLNYVGITIVINLIIYISSIYVKSNEHFSYKCSL